MKKTFCLGISLIVLFSSCGYIGGKRVEGNGNWKTEERTVSAFNSVEAHGAVNVYLSQGPAKPVRIEADENLMEYIEVYVSGNSLMVRNRSGYNLKPTGEMKVFVTIQDFKRVEVSGASDIIGEGSFKNPENISLGVSGAGKIVLQVDAPKVTIDISGAGSVKLEGTTKEVDLGLSGAGSAKCFDLKAETVHAGISGAGNAEVFASVKLTGSISGAGNIKYKGGAAADVSKSGAGSVTKVD